MGLFVREPDEQELSELVDRAIDSVIDAWRKGRSVVLWFNFQFYVLDSPVALTRAQGAPYEPPFNSMF